MALRWAVFVEEQNVPPADELDGQDCDCIHVIARDETSVLGAARFRITDDVVKIQRVCVKAQARGQGAGAALINWICQKSGSSIARLSAQADALPFYERLGFAATGPAYLDAGIEHRDMEKPL